VSNISIITHDSTMDESSSPPLESLTSRTSKEINRKAMTLATDYNTASKSKSHSSTKIMCLVTITVIVSFLPHLSLMTTNIIMEKFVEGLSSTGVVFYELFLNSYLINSISNSIIYGFCDRRFRNELRRLLWWQDV
jgi:hypothetical protein